jgi:succinyl-CoA synthetase beta subunit
VNIHEYQAREILRSHGIPVPPGEVAATPEEAEAIARRLRGQVVVKAQVHAGGRGKAGGVKLAATPQEAGEKAAAILGLEIKGLTVQKVLVAPAAEIAHEYYLGVVLDRKERKPLVMVSREGGIDIEEVARTRPEAIHRMHFDPQAGLRPYQARKLAFRLTTDPAETSAIASVLQKLAAAFVAADASLAEINPLVRTPSGEILAIDAKINLDDNALYRHPALEELRDLTAEPEEERMARKQGLSYIKLDGRIGCVVNGAGLAMATMDLVKHHGGDPANFLDIGGSSDPAKVVTAIRIITADSSVRSILFNIFGGITRCDDVANGLVQAIEVTGVKIPIVIRLTGTNEAEAREILAKVPGLTPAETMDEAVQKAVQLAGA